MNGTTAIGLVLAEVRQLRRELLPQTWDRVHDLFLALRQQILRTVGVPVIGVHPLRELPNRGWDEACRAAFRQFNDYIPCFPNKRILLRILDRILDCPQGIHHAQIINGLYRSMKDCFQPPLRKILSLLAVVQERPDGHQPIDRLHELNAPQFITVPKIGALSANQPPERIHIDLRPGDSACRPQRLRVRVVLVVRVQDDPGLCQRRKERDQTGTGRRAANGKRNIPLLEGAHVFDPAVLLRHCQRIDGLCIPSRGELNRAMHQCARNLCILRQQVTETEFMHRQPADLLPGIAKTDKVSELFELR